MFCSNCGKENQLDSLFCEACGSKMEDEQQEVSTKGTRSEKVNESKDFYYDNGNVDNPKNDNVKKTLSTKKKIGIIAGIIIILSIATFYVVGKSLSNPQKVAEKFMQCEMDKDWDGMYKYLSIQESEFVNKDLFVKLRSEGDNEEEITNFSVSSSPELDDSNDGVEKNMIIKYTAKGSSNSDSSYLKVVKQEGKFLFFFDKWKVSSEEIIDDAYSVSTPSGTTVYLDGIELTDKYKDESANNEYSNRYKINEVLKGEHKIKVTSLIFDDYEEDMKDSGYVSVDINDLKLKQEHKEATETIAKNIMKDYYDAGIAGKKYEDIKGYFSSDKEVQKDMESKYASFLKTIKPDPESGLKTITFTNVEVTASKSSYYNGVVKMNIKFDYEFTGTEKNLFSKEIEEFTSGGIKSSSKGITFTYEEGKWVIKSIDSLRLYY